MGYDKGVLYCRYSSRAVEQALQQPVQLDNNLLKFESLGVMKLLRVPVSMARRGICPQSINQYLITSDEM